MARVTRVSKDDDLRFGLGVCSGAMTEMRKFF